MTYIQSYIMFRVLPSSAVLNWDWLLASATKRTLLLDLALPRKRKYIYSTKLIVATLGWDRRGEEGEETRGTGKSGMGGYLRIIFICTSFFPEETPPEVVHSSSHRYPSLCRLARTPLRRNRRYHLALLPSPRAFQSSRWANRNNRNKCSSHQRFLPTTSLSYVYLPATQSPHPSVLF